jgi:hypothetical protein
LSTLFGLANLAPARSYLGARAPRLQRQLKNAGRVPRERSFSPGAGPKTKPEPANSFHSTTMPVTVKKN